MTKTSSADDPHKHEKREKNYGADISTLIRMIEAGRFEPVPTLFYEYPNFVKAGEN